MFILGILAILLNLISAINWFYVGGLSSYIAIVNIAVIILCVYTMVRWVKSID